MTRSDSGAHAAPTDNQVAGVEAGLGLSMSPEDSGGEN